MNPAQWTAVDDYLEAQLLSRDPVLEEIVAAAHRAGFPPIAVSPLQGRMLQILAQLQGARHILEIGTLAGYSTLWLARALPPDGRIVTLELEPRHAEMARSNFHRTGLMDTIEVRVGPACESLQQLITEKAGPFDFIFIDADKAGIPRYFEQALALSRRGTAIVVDNVIRRGEVADENSSDEAVRGVREFLTHLSEDARVSATTIQTVGRKGYDGFTLAVVRG